MLDRHHYEMLLSQIDIARWHMEECGEHLDQVREVLGGVRQALPRLTLHARHHAQVLRELVEIEERLDAARRHPCDRRSSKRAINGCSPVAGATKSSRARLAAYLAALAAPLSILTPAAAESAASVDVSHPQVRVPTRPAASLFEGAPARQHTELHYDPSTQTVTIKMLVQDPHGYFIPNIRRENFVVYEDGQRQHNASVEIERSRVTLSVLLEYGGRYRGLNAALARELYPAVNQFLDEFGREDSVNFFRYGDHLEKLADFSDGHDTLQRSLLNINEAPAASEANFYDALIETLSGLGARSGRKALLIFSSGLDTFSRHKFRDALEAARQADIPIYVIGLGPVLEHDLGSQRFAGVYAAYDWHRAASELQEIARASGGRVYAPDSTYSGTRL